MLRRVLAYYASLFSDALRGAVSLWLRHFRLELITTVGPVFVIWWRLGTRAVLEQNLLPAFLAALAWLGFLLALYTVVGTGSRLLLTPARLQERVEDLEHVPDPAFELTPLTYRKREYEDRPHLMWADLEVRNLTRRTLHDVEVVLDDYIVPGDWDAVTGERIRSLVEPRAPVTLVWSVVNAKPNQSRMTIPAGDTKILSVAYCDDSNGQPAFFSILNERRSWPISEPWNTRRLRPAPGRVRFIVRSPDAASVTADFYLECVGNQLIPIPPDEPDPEPATYQVISGGQVIEEGDVGSEVLQMGRRRFVPGPRAHFEFRPWDEYRLERQSTGDVDDDEA